MLSYGVFCHKVKTLWLKTSSGNATAQRSRFCELTSDTPQDFESALAELEGIVAAMEGSQMPLKDALAAYKRGAVLVAYCQGALKDAQLEIEVLEKGVLKPFAPDGDGP